MVTSEIFLDELDRLSRRLMRNLECCDRSVVSCCGLTAAQAYSLLTMSEYGPMTMNEIALEMRLHGTTMTRMVDSLVAKGLAERSNDAEDRRIVRVELTSNGEETVKSLQEFKRSLLSSAFAELGSADRDAILSALRRLTTVAEELGARCC